MPEGVYSAGTIFLQVVPSYRGLQDSIREKVGEVDRALNADMERNAAKTGERVGKVLGENIAKSAEPGAKRAAEKYEGAFRTSLKRAASAAQKELDAINFDTASDRTLEQLELIKRRMRDLGKTKIDAEFDGRKALAEIEALDKALADIKKNRRVEDIFDLGAAQKSIAAMRKSVDDELARIKIPDRVLKQVDRDMGAFEATIKKHVKSAFDSIGDSSEPQLKKLRKSMDDILKAEFNIDMDSGAVVAEVQRIKLALNALKANHKIDIGTRGNAAAAVESFERISKALDDISPKVDKVDRQMSKFAREFQKGVKGALADLGDAREFDDIRDRLNSLKDIDLDIEVDSQGALSELAAVAAAAKAVGAVSPDIRIQTNAASAAAQLAAAGIAGRAASTGGIAGHGDDAANSFRAFNAVILASVSLGSALIPVLGGIAGGLAALGPAAAGGVAGLGVMMLGFSGIGDAVSGLMDVEKNAAADARDTSEQIRTALQAVADAERSLSRTRQDAAESNEDAARRVRRAQQDSAQANRDAAEAIVDAQSDAAEANRDAAEAIVEAQRNAAEATRDASQAINEAQRSAAQANEDAARRTASAQRSAAQAVQDALRRQQDAEENLADAQRDARDAVEDLREARRLAQQDLDDIADRQRQNALDERQAVIDLFNATVQDTAARQDPGATNLEREQASINLEQAKLRLEEIREEEKELAKQRRQGVEGTDRVQSAQDALTSALEAQKDAQEALQEAAQASDRARVEGARNVREALRAQRRTAVEGARDIAEAERNLVEVRRDGLEAIQEAEETAAETRRDGIDAITDAQEAANRTRRNGAQNVADAVRDQQRTEVDGQQAISDAQRRLNRAQGDYRRALKETGEVGSTSMENLRDAMSKLSPAGRRFARYLFSLRDEFYAIRAAAQQGMLPGVQNAMQMIIGRYGRPFIGFVRRMARTIGGLFETLGRRLTRGGFEEFFGMLNRLGPRFMRQFGRAFINWLETFAYLMVATAPFARRFSNALLDLSNRALKWMESGKGAKTWQDFLAWAFRIGPKVVSFFSALWAAAVNLGKALAPLGEVVLTGLTKFLRFIGNMDPKLLGIIAMTIMGLVFAFQLAAGAIALVSGAVAVFSKVAIGGMMVALGPIVLGIAAAVAALIILYTQSKTARKIIDAAFTAIRKVVKWAFEYTIWIWGKVADAAKWLWREILGPVFKELGKIFGAFADEVRYFWREYLSPVFEKIGEIVEWLWKKVFKPVFGSIGDIVAKIFRGIVWVWKNILWPVIKVVGQIVWELWKLAFKVAFEKIGAAWDGLASGFRWVWRNVLKPLFDLFMDVIGDDIVKAFKDAVGFIRKHWDTIKEIAKAPIRFVIETVINKGLIGGFNWLAEKVGMKEIKEIPLPKGFARGGIPSARDTSVYPGYTPGRDVGLIGISGGEGIIRPEATRVLGKSWIDRVNNAARSGGKAAVERLFMGGYARGGIVGNIQKRYWPVPGRDTSTYPNHDGVDINRGSGWDDHGDPIVSVMNGRVNYVGTGRGYGLAAFIQTLMGELVYGHMSAARVKAGDVVRGGQMIGRVGNTGNSSAPHLHFGFPGGTFEEAMTVLRGGAFPSDGNWTTDVGNAVDAFGAKVMDALLAPARWLTDKAKDGLDALKDRFGDNLFTDLVTAIPEKLIDGLANWIGEEAPEATAQAVGNYKGPLRLRKAVTEALKIMNQPLSLVGDVLRRMDQESDFNPNVVNRWDSNWDAGHPSVGLMQVIGPTYDAYKHPKYDVGPYKYGTSVNPLANILASMRYAMDVYGSLGSAYNRPGGYADGGIVDEPNAPASGVPDNGMMLYDNGGYLPPGITHVLNLTGQPEPVFNPDQWQRVQGGGGSGFTYAPTFMGRDEPSDILDDLLVTAARMRRGGVYTGTRD